MPTFVEKVYCYHYLCLLIIRKEHCGRNTILDFPYICDSILGTLRRENLEFENDIIKQIAFISYQLYGYI